MTKQLIHLVDSDLLCIGDLSEAANRFIFQHKVKPTSIKVKINDLDRVVRMMPTPFHFLEKGKDYGMFVNSILGPVQVDLFDDGTQVTVAQNISFNHATSILVENDDVDREFEKVVLDS